MRTAHLPSGSNDPDGPLGFRSSATRSAALCGTLHARAKLAENARTPQFVRWPDPDVSDSVKGWNAMSMIDLRSDTVTLPPDGMRDAIAVAALGDDFYRADPTVRLLERKAAELLGKEAALLVLSGTMGNLVSLLALVEPGTEVIIEADAHVFRAEAGGIARVAGLMPRRIPGRNGVLDPAAVEAEIVPRSMLSAGTSAICLENSHNTAGGTVTPLDSMAAMRQLADQFGLRLHLDGARIFNAAAALGVPAGEIAALADSVTFCLSKGLACPLGAVVAGAEDFIQRARHTRQTLGGGMRQAGIIAAAGVWALDNMVDRLAEDHDNARRLAELAVDAGFAVDLTTVQTNMVRLDTRPIPADIIRERLEQQGVASLAVARFTIRLVTHWGISGAAVQQVGEAMNWARRRELA